MDDRAPSEAPVWWRSALLVVGVIALAAGLAVIDSRPVGVVHDDAMYVILARSLATGQGFRYLNLPGAPAATHFPPGYPALLALLSWIAPAFPRNLIVFKMMNAVLLAAGAVLVTRFARGRALDARWAVGLGVATALSIPMLILGSLVLSEPLFFAATIAVLPALEALADRPSKAKQVLAMGVAIAACTLVRSNAIVLLPAVAIVLVARRRWRDLALVTLSTIVCLLPWQLWTAAHTGVLAAPLQGNYESYTSWWFRGLRTMGAGMVPTTLSMTSSATANMLAVLFSPVGGSLAHAITLIGLAALAVNGVIRTWRRIPVTLLFVAGYLAIVLLWPFPPERFLWAVWPLLLMIVAAGAISAVSDVRALRSRVVDRPWSLALAAAFAWVVIGYGLYELRGARGSWWSSVPRANAPRITAASDWITAHSDSGQVIAAEDEGAAYLYTGRPVVPVLSFTTEQYLRGLSAEENARGGLGPILEAYPVCFVVVGTRKTVDAADALVAARRLHLVADFAGGVAYSTGRCRTVSR
jgi:hypothetical protein